MGRVIKAMMVAPLLAASAGVIWAAGSANAASTTFCSGTGSDVRIRGDLVVPAGATCELVGSRIEEDVTVREGANLIIEDVRIDGRVVVDEDAFFDATDSEVDKTVSTRSAFGAFLESSHVDSTVRANEIRGSQVESALYVIDTTIDGDLTADAGQLLAESSTIADDLVGENTVFTDVLDTVVEGDMSVEDSESSLVCRSEVYGDAVFEDNSALVQIGGDGPLWSCEQPNFWMRDLIVEDNNGEVFIDGNIFRDDLRAKDNATPVMLGETNRVRGEVVGQTEQASAEGMQSTTAAEDHSQQLRSKVEQRRAEASADAHAAGDAF